MSTRKTQLLKRIAGKKGRSTAITEEEKALRAIGDAIENGEIGGGKTICIRGEGNSMTNGEAYTVPEGTFETLMNNLYHGTVPNVMVQFLMPGSGNAVMAYAAVADDFFASYENYSEGACIYFSANFDGNVYRFCVYKGDRIGEIELD